MRLSALLLALALMVIGVSAWYPDIPLSPWSIGEVLVLAFLSDPANLWLYIFCSRYGFFSFVLSLISTVCELFFTKEVPCFTLQDIFISGEVLVLAFLSDPSNLWLDIFCSRYGFFHLFCLWFQNFNIAFDYLLMLTIFYVPKFL